MNKQEWIEELTRKKNVNCFFEKKINGKKVKLSYFAMYATEEQKMDKDLNILNFENTGKAFEIPESMVDFDFVKRAFQVKESSNIFNLPYEWKNNIEEKEFLKEVLNIFKNRQRDYKSYEIMWSFEPGFWSDLTYTKTIREENYYYIEMAVIDHLNKSNKDEDIQYLLEIVNKVPYYLKYIKSKYKQLLEEHTVISYAKDYGIASLTKEQKNRYMVIKEAFHHQKISYDKLDNKWKTAEILKDLLNNKEIWSIVINGQKFLSINQLSLELLNDKEIIKSCLSNGYNLIELKNNTYSASKWFFDKEMKAIALKTYVDYTIIEDCLDNKDIVLEFLTLLKQHYQSLFSGSTIKEQTKNIDPTLFQDKEIMSKYLSIQCLNEKKYFNPNAIEALKSFSKEDIKEFLKSNTYVYEVLEEVIKDYKKEDIIDLININKDIYRIIIEEKQKIWEVVSAFVIQNKTIDFCIPKEIRDEIKEMNGTTNEEKIIQITKKALNEKLTTQLEKKMHVKRSKI